MDKDIWLALIATALGTVLMRALPLVWMRRRLARQGEDGPVKGLPGWLSILGPTMIAGMLGVSLVPGTITVTSILATLCGTILTLAVWWRTRSLGWPVAVGVLTFGVVTLAAHHIL